MRFHLDEHVAHAIAEGLRRRGIDVSTTVEAGLLSAPDEDHLAFALRERRVIYTQDADFLRNTASDSSHFGVVYCPHGKRSFGEVIRFLALMHDVMAENEMRGRVEYL
jgi:predicted nuclease of predicted toxin-antitoxin system